MKVTRYEIDKLNVKAADAFLIHFFNDENKVRPTFRVIMFCC